MPKRKYRSPPSSSATKSSSARKRRRTRGNASKIQALFRGYRYRKKHGRFKSKYHRVWTGAGFARRLKPEYVARIKKNRNAAIAKRAKFKKTWSGKSFEQKLLARMRALEIKQSGRLPSKAEKRKMAGVASNNFEELYRKYCGRDGDQQDPQLYSRGHGQLVLKNGLISSSVFGNTPEKPEPYIDKISHKPYYHMEDWSDLTQPWHSYRRLIGETDTVHNLAFPNGLSTYDQSVDTNLRAPTIVSGVETEKHPGLEGDSATTSTKLHPHLDRISYYGYRERKIDLMPLVFHRKQLEGILEETSSNDAEGVAQSWAAVAPKRLTDKIRIKNLWVKFDFDTKFSGDEGTRNNVFVVNPMALHDQSVSTNPLTGGETPGAPYNTNTANGWAGYRTNLEYDNRVSNTYAKVRVIIGRRKKFGTSASDRVSLNHVLQSDDTDSYKHGHGNEEVLIDLFNRRCKKYGKQSGINHVTIDDEDYEMVIEKDEIIKLGKGHSVKHFNLFKGVNIPYMSTESDKNIIKDIYMTEYDPHPNPPTPTLIDLYNRFGHCDIKNSQLNSMGDENLTSKADKLCIPIGNDLFMYVITLTRAASVKWRITSKMTYTSV